MGVSDQIVVGAPGQDSHVNVSVRQMVSDGRTELQNGLHTESQHVCESSVASRVHDHDVKSVVEKDLANDATSDQWNSSDVSNVSTDSCIEADTPIVVLAMESSTNPNRWNSTDVSSVRTGGRTGRVKMAARPDFRNRSDVSEETGGCSSSKRASKDQHVSEVVCVELPVWYCEHRVNCKSGVCGQPH